MLSRFDSQTREGVTDGYDGQGRQDCWIFPSTTRPGNFNDSTPDNALSSAGAVSGDCVTTGDYERYTYDPHGNRLSLRKRDGSLLNYQYDALNRVTVKSITTARTDLSAAQIRPVYYGYDNRNLQTSARFDSATGQGVTNAYDGFGRLVSTSTIISNVARTLTYAYDADGSRTSLTHPDHQADHQAFTFRYDGLDRFIGVRQPDTSDVLGITYNNATQPYVIGWATTATAYLYDGVGRPSYLVDDMPNGAGVNWTFGYNPAGEIASTTRSNDAYAWTRHHASSLGYEANGLNQYNRITSVGYDPTTLTYDANGNLTSDGNRTYPYDVENRLVAASAPTVGPGIAVQMGYDPLGRLAWTTGNPNFTQFLYDGDALVAEYDYSGNIIARYVHGPGADRPLIWYDGAAIGHDNLRSLYTDHQGSIVAISDFVGNRLALNTYDEYGIPGAANQGRFQYTGQTWLPELGMYYYKARIYSPTLGRFMQIDPIGYADQVNLYEYVGDDPLDRTDPTGLAGQDEHLQDVLAGRVPGAVTPEQATASGTMVGNWLQGLGEAINSLPDGVIVAGPLTALGREVSAGNEALQGESAASRAAADVRAANVERGIPASRLGPSGRPLRHFPHYNSRSAARDAAQNRTARGQSSVEHSNPAVGDPHFHAVDRRGNKAQDGVHHTYPRRQGGRGGRNNESD